VTERVIILITANGAVNGPPFAAVQIMCHRVSFLTISFRGGARARPRTSSARAAV